MSAAPKKDPERSVFGDYDYSNFYYGAGDDPLNLLGPFSSWYEEALPAGYYLYSEPLSTAPGTARAGPEPQDGRGPGAAQPGVVQLPRHLVPRRGQGSGDRGHAQVRPGRLRLADPLRHVRRPQRARRRRSPSFKDKEAGDPLPDGLQRERRVHLRAHALGRHDLLRPVLARVDRGRRHPGQVEDRVLPPQQPARPRAEARRACAARSWWWSRASTRWTATSACCPRSSRWPSATARAS